MSSHLPLWVRSAQSHIADLSVPAVVMIATVDAESAGATKLVGDVQSSGEPMAWGFGHVWLRWHMWALVRAASELKIRLPYTEWQAGTVNRELGQFLISRETLNWRVTALVVGYFWEASRRKAGGMAGIYRTYDYFLRSYVGPAIPATDVTRRTLILNYWEDRLKVREVYTDEYGNYPAQ